MKEKKILIVEDEIVFRTTLELYLKSLGAQVFLADNGQDALHQLTRGDITPDIILCDLSMPIMTGTDFMSSLVALKLNIPVIVISGTTDFSQVDHMLRLGAKDALLKPINNLSEIKQAILTYLYPQRYASNELAETEFHHISALLQQQDNKVNNVLMQLQPPICQIMNGYRINYRQLNDIDHLGLILDLAPLSDHQIGFYCIDIERSPHEGAMAALLIRVVFNNLLKNAVNNPERKLPKIEQIIQHLNYLLDDSGFNGQFPLVLGYFNTKKKTIIITSAGLEVELKTEANNYSLKNSVPLGTLKNLYASQLDEKGTDWQCKISNKGHQITLMFTSLSPDDELL